MTFEFSLPTTLQFAGGRREGSSGARCLMLQSCSFSQYFGRYNSHRDRCGESDWFKRFKRIGSKRVRAWFRLIIQFVNPTAYTVSIAHGRCRARAAPLFIFFGDRTYRMPGMYLPRITEPRRCRGAGKGGRGQERRGEARERKKEQVGRWKNDRWKVPEGNEKNPCSRLYV